MCCCDFILVLLALVFPPLPVWIKVGFCSTESLINIVLCFLGYIPGVIHSLYIIAKYPIKSKTYIIIQDEESQLFNHPRQHTAQPQHHCSPVVVIRERVQTPTNEQITQNNSNTVPFYGSTSDQPPRYSEFEAPRQGK